MHFHIPKPLHGWREFVGEVAIIVLGVTIALSAEQLVQHWSWHRQSVETKRALSSELESSALFAIERVAVQQCLRDRIKHLTDKLNSGATNWTADPMILGSPKTPMGSRDFPTSIPLAYRTPHRPWLSDEWETAKSTGIIDHMDRKDATNFEFVYRGVDQLNSLQDEETSTLPQINFLSFDDSIQPQSREQVLIALSRLDLTNTWIAIVARQMLATMRSMHLRFDPANRFGGSGVTFGAARERMLVALIERYGPCVIAAPNAT